MTSYVHAGRLGHRVSIETPVQAADSYGQAVITWTPVATVWAAVEPIRGREYTAAGAEQSAVSTKITIRARSDVTQQERIVWGTRVYEIKSAIDVAEEGRRMELMCEEMTT